MHLFIELDEDIVFKLFCNYLNNLAHGTFYATSDKQSVLNEPIVKLEIGK